MKRRHLALALIALLAGCATSPGEFWTKPIPTASLLVIALGDAPPEYGAFAHTSVNFALRRVGDTTVGYLGYSPKRYAQQGEKYQDADGRGTVQIRYLPPGDYELFDPSFFVFRGALSYSRPPTQTFRIQFTVREGEVTYLGRFASAAGEDMFFWLDREANDLELARKQIAAPLQILRVSRATVVDVPGGLLVLGKGAIPKAK